MDTKDTEHMDWFDAQDTATQTRHLKTHVPYGKVPEFEDQRMAQMAAHNVLHGYRQINDYAMDPRD